MTPSRFPPIFGLAFVGLVLTSACGTKDEEYRYAYSENGCSTGEHEFDSFESYCKGLKDNALNKGCSTGFRRDEYNAKCQGFGPFAELS